MDEDWDFQKFYLQSILLLIIHFPAGNVTGYQILNHADGS
jgi:hypothetical protein